MQPHSTSEQVLTHIREVEAQERMFIATPDARAICSWYMEPNANPYLTQFVQGQNVNVRGLMLEVIDLAQEMFADGTKDHYHLLYALAFIGMRCGITAIIEGTE